MSGAPESGPAGASAPGGLESPSNPLNIVSPWAAMLMSCLVLPGLGQILTGRLLKGALMAGAVTIWLPVAMTKLGRDLARVWPEIMARTPPGGTPVLADFQAALQPLAGGLGWIFLPLLLIWLWTFLDSIMYSLRQLKGKIKR